MKYLIPFLFVWMTHTVLMKAQGFTPVPSTGLPYIVVVKSVSVDPTVTVKEIGIFDDTLCVGASGEITGYPLSITTWKKDESLNLSGFTVGATISYKALVQQGTNNYVVSGNAQYEQGNGSFGSGAFTATTLSLGVPTAIEQSQGVKPSSSLLVYPNPAKEVAYLSWKREAGEQTLRIYDTLGREVFTATLAHNNDGISNIVWDLRSTAGTKVSAGRYIAVVSEKEIVYSAIISVIR